MEVIYRSRWQNTTSKPLPNFVTWNVTIHNAIKWQQICKLHIKQTYLSPIVLRCWPISRTMSWLVLSIILAEISPFGPPLIALISDVCSVPFCWLEDPEWSSDTPLRCVQPFAACCIVASKVRGFFRGGGASPPSSDSPLEARLANRSPWWNFAAHTILSEEILYESNVYHSHNTAITFATAEQCLDCDVINTDLGREIVD